MLDQENDTLITRRRALILGAGLTAGLVARTGFALESSRAQAQDGSAPSGNGVLAKDIQSKIESILQAKGKVSNGLFSVTIDRNDLTDVKLKGVPIKPAFQINGQLYFQDLGDGRALMNGDFPLKPTELNAFIDQLISHKIVIQAEHQHMYDFSPIVWFMHFRAIGDPMQIAHGMKDAYGVTTTRFPQKPAGNPKSPLPAEEIGQILGAKATVGADGTVHLNVPRAETIRLGGIAANPYLNIAAPIAFQPYGVGQNAAAVPDFAMLAHEVNDVMQVMRQQGWDIGCLYNQETDEHPQLYFSHQFKTGDAIQLAHEIRNGLNKTNSKFM